ncbi:MAG: hypothetical protein HY347_05740 [candidate division NC10 bacterium]|nr:hypothetical protein [candidate division NC10 bacterium]
MSLAPCGMFQEREQGSLDVSKPEGRWQPAILWGLLQNVKRRGGKFYIRRICRELLEAVNQKQGESQGSIESEHAEGSWKVKSRDFFEVLDSSEVEKLADEVASDLERMLQ